MKQSLKHTSKATSIARVGAAVVIGIGLLVTTWSSAFATSGIGMAAPCKPGSGKQLAGAKVTQAQIGTGHDLRCANLRGADLSGLSLQQINLEYVDFHGATLNGADLTQAEMTGAVFTDAKLVKADLTQATIEHTDFSGANLENAQLSQADAKSANFTKASLSGVDLSQVDLTDAQLDHAAIGGADFTQATTKRTSFVGVTGLLPYDLYLLIAAAVIFVVWVGMFVKSLGGLELDGSAKTRALGLGILGRLVAVVGMHMVGGYLLAQVTSMFGQPTALACNGPQCSVGVSMGILGILVGIVTLVVGIGIASKAVTKSEPVPKAQSMRDRYRSAQ